MNTLRHSSRNQFSVTSCQFLVFS